MKKNLNLEICLKINKIILEYSDMSENKGVLKEMMGIGQKEQELAYRGLNW